MGNLMKIVLMTAPALFLVLYFVISSQKSIDIQMQKNDAEFSRSWAEQEAEMAKDLEKKKIYQDRAKAAELEMEELKKKEKDREEKDRQFEEAMEKALRDSEEELKEKLKK